jgi:hypothetical protein
MAESKEPCMKARGLSVPEFHTRALLSLDLVHDASESHPPKKWVKSQEGKRG